MINPGSAENESVGCCQSEVLFHFRCKIWNRSMIADKNLHKLGILGFRAQGSTCILRQMAPPIDLGLADSTIRESDPGERTGERTRPHVDGVESSRQLSSEEMPSIGEGEVVACRSGGEAAGVIDLISSEDEGSGGDSVGVETAGIVDLVSSEDEGSGDDTGPGRDDEGVSNITQQSLANTPRGKRASRVENAAGLTPNFRSAAAMAGWDDEALLLAVGDQESPAGLPLKQALGRGTPEGPSRVSCSSACEGCTQCPQCRERKRGTRTPGQAATPLSAGRRHRRVRRVSSNEEPLVPIPMAVLVDEGDKCSHQQLSQDKENRNTPPCAMTTSLKATGEATGEAAEGSKIENGALQLDKLREELTCVVCLDVCFEPSTTTCGHSFCRGCLQSVFQRCGMRCPKCRQELRATSKNDCPINTVLWNTIQLLFPQETAARLKDQKDCEKVEKIERAGSERIEQAESQLRPGLVRRRIARPVPWRELVTSSRETERSRPQLLSFGRPSDVLESGQSTANYPTRFIRLRVRRPTSMRNAETLRQQDDELRSIMPASSWRNLETLRQEEEDAALAARLQQSYISEAGL